MTNYFDTRDGRQCGVTIWQRGAYGFSLPKKVEIQAPDGAILTYLYKNVGEMTGVELSARLIARIAIAQFLWFPGGSVTQLNSNMPMYDGELDRAEGRRSAPPIAPPLVWRQSKASAPEYRSAPPRGRYGNGPPNKAT